MKQLILRFVAGCFLFAGMIPCIHASPVNDDFTNRTVLTGSSVTFTGTLQGATMESGEPIVYYAQPQGASVWWSWKAGTSGPVTVELLNVSTNSLKVGGIDVWTGTNWLSDFHFVAGFNLDIGRHPFYTFAATANTTYQLRMVGPTDGGLTLKITETNVPIVVVQPVGRTVSTGESVFFGVVAAGDPPFSPAFSYQWRSNGVDLPGETFPILSLDNLATNQSAVYSVVVSNGVSAVESDPATLTVNDGAVPPKLVPIGSAGGWINFGIAGDTGRLYRIESSTDLFNWANEMSLLPHHAYFYAAGGAGSVVFNNQNPVSAWQYSPQRFYRALNYVPSVPACMNNLAKIRFAKEIWSLETKSTAGYTPVPDQITPYLKGGVVLCPSAGGVGNLESNYGINGLGVSPFCKIFPFHVLEEPEF